MAENTLTEDPENKLMTPTPRCGDNANERQRDATGVQGKGLVKVFMLAAQRRCESRRGAITDKALTESQDLCRVPPLEEYLHPPLK